MSEIIVESKNVAVPGEMLAKGMDCIPSFGTYRDGENIYASRLGLISIEGKVIKIIPLSGAYVPKKGDVIIGKVIDILLAGWRLDIGSAYTGYLSLKDGTQDFVSKGTDITKYFNFDEYLMSSIINVTTQNLVDLSMKGPGLRKLSGGRIVCVSCHKVPRIIGKHGSMVSMIKNATNCKILVGQNGFIWIDGEPESEVIATKAIRKIEELAHVSGLTEMIKVFLEKETGQKVEIPEKIEESQSSLGSENQNRGFRDSRQGFNRSSPNRSFDRNSQNKSFDRNGPRKPFNRNGPKSFDRSR